MLKKIISIKNVGRFRDSAGSGNPQLAKHTFIIGANSYGKTTICAVLRSLQTGDASHVLGRKTLGVADAATIELLLDNGSARFDGVAWNATCPTIAIFDGVFVAENVHSGEVVEIDHKRNLYRIIIGDEGVKLAEEDAALAANSRAKTGEISTAANAIQPYIPAGMNLDAFIAITAAADIDQQITEQGRVVEAAQQASAIGDRTALSEFALPTIQEGLTDLLSRTIDDIAHERLLSDHLTAHGMMTCGGNWIAKGIEHAGDTCPFCGQDIRALPLIAAFRVVFSERYKALGRGHEDPDYPAIRRCLPDLIRWLSRTKAALSSGANTAPSIPFLWLFLRASRWQPESFGAALALLDQKAGTPLESIAADERFTSALTAYGTAQSSANSVNDAIRAVNGLIVAKKAEMGAVDVKTAEAELTRRQAIRTRHTEAVVKLCVVKLCEAHIRLVKAKAAIDEQKEANRTRLNVHTKGVVKPYEKRINDYLSASNADFKITETKHGYPGGIATSSYQLLINDVAIDVGDGKTRADRPSFKNTLSAGDRSTLALAFFLAHLERNPAVAGKTVVFDDPFNSQDAFRRGQTVHEIMKIAGKCAQVVVLSHDATFLKQVWDKAPPSGRVALMIVDHRAQGFKIMPGDLEKACQRRTAIDIDDLQNYLTTGTGAPLDLIRKMRVVLETHCRTTYSACFLDEDPLGEILRKIREGGDTHPAHPLYDELDQINGYTGRYHHGEDLADATTDKIDPTELTGFVRKTLKIWNASQA